MLSLLAGIADRLSRRSSNQAFRDEVIGKALAFKMNHIVDRFRRQEEISEFQALELERELKRYLAMCAIYPRITFPMEGPVDELWHVFLTYSVDYRRFCDGIAGRMIHHWPGDGAPNRRSRRPAGHDTFVRIYKDLFGVLPAPHVWPFMDALRQRQRGRSDSYAAGNDGCGGSASSHSFRDSDNSGSSDGGGGGCGGGGD